MNGSNPWLFGGADELALITRLENEYPLIEEVGCKVYIVDGSLEIEDSRKLPTILASDIVNKETVPGNKYLINTCDANGIICLDDFPLLKLTVAKASSITLGKYW